MQLSIIIPVYNGERMLHPLLTKISNTVPVRHIKETEIIIIDDGSKDSSVSEVTKFISLNNSISINFISKKNGGVSSARNDGLSKVTGKYVTFIDCDDDFSSNYFEEFYNECENEDFLYANLVRSTKEKKIENLDRFSTDNIIEIENHVTSRFFKTRILKENSLFFDETLSIGEDFLFLFTYLGIIDKNKVLHLDKSEYYYIVDNEGSAMNTADTNKKISEINRAWTLLKDTSHLSEFELDYLFLKNNIIRVLPKLFSTLNVKNQINIIDEQINLYIRDLKKTVNLPSIYNETLYFKEKTGESGFMEIKKFGNSPFQNYVVSIRILVSSTLNKRRL